MRFVKVEMSVTLVPRRCERGRRWSSSTRSRTPGRAATSQACRQNGGAREREGQQPVTKPWAAVVVVAGRSRTRVSPLALAHEGLQDGWKE